MTNDSRSQFFLRFGCFLLKQPLNWLFVLSFTHGGRHYEFHILLILLHIFPSICRIVFIFYLQPLKESRSPEAPLLLRSQLNSAALSLLFLLYLSLNLLHQKPLWFLPGALDGHQVKGFFFFYWKPQRASAFSCLCTLSVCLCFSQVKTVFVL